MSTIDGLEILPLDVRGDSRGWFKENWHAARGPELHPVQNNVSFNAEVGTTRGLHAEPWDKYVSVAAGEVFGAWVDLREGSPTYGCVATAHITPDVAVFVPRGVANGFQALEPNTVYTYLVNDHWSPEAKYTCVHLDSVGIDWPIPIAQAVISEKDAHHPPMQPGIVVPRRKVLVLGATGQLGQALAAQFPDANCFGKEIDITNLEALEALQWRDYRAVINAAAYTAVDAAEQNSGAAWAVNAQGAANVARMAAKFQIPVVHFSSDYVFNGVEETHSEDEPFSPLGVYGASKAAGDVAVGSVEKHYVLRTSWVVGQGKNFVATMLDLKARGVVPKVVADQVGRLTFASELARAAWHLLETGAEFGTYNVTCTGPSASWWEVAASIIPDAQACTTAEYGAAAPRPAHSTLALDKLQQAGFTPRDWREMLQEYVQQYNQQHEGQAQ